MEENVEGYRYMIPEKENGLRLFPLTWKGRWLAVTAIYLSVREIAAVQAFIKYYPALFW